MTVAPPPHAPARRVLHVLPRDLARGTPVVARELQERLDRPGDHHRSLTLFADRGATLDPDMALDFAPGVMCRAGFDPRLVPVLRRTLRELEPDVIVAHGDEPLKYCAPARPEDTPLIYSRTCSGGAVRGRWHLGYHRRLVERADMVVAVSDDVAHEVATLFGVGADRLVTIPDGRDPRLFEPDRTARTVRTGQDTSVSAVCPSRPGPVRLVFLSQLNPPERPLWFLELLARLISWGSPVEGVVIGEGPLSDAVGTAARGLPVELVGGCGQRRVARLLSDADLLVLTGRASDEGMPGALLEAGLAGLPVVTTAVPGASTVVRNGVTGHITPVDDFDDMVQRTAELLVDPARRRRMGQAARQRCLTLFTLDAVAERWRRMLDAVTGAVALAPPRHRVLASR